MAFPISISPDRDNLRYLARAIVISSSNTVNHLNRHFSPISVIPLKIAANAPTRESIPDRVRRYDKRGSPSRRPAQLPLPSFPRRRESRGLSTIALNSTTVLLCARDKLSPTHRSSSLGDAHTPDAARHPVCHSSAQCLTAQIGMRQNETFLEIGRRRTRRKGSERGDRHRSARTVPPSSPRTRESIPDKVRRYDTGSSPSRGRPNQVGNPGRHFDQTPPRTDAGVELTSCSRPRLTETHGVGCDLA